MKFLSHTVIFAISVIFKDTHQVTPLSRYLVLTIDILTLVAMKVS